MIVYPSGLNFFFQGPQGAPGTPGFSGPKGAVVCFMLLMMWIVFSICAWTFCLSFGVGLILVSVKNVHNVAASEFVLT